MLGQDKVEQKVGNQFSQSIFNFNANFCMPIIIGNKLKTA